MKEHAHYSNYLDIYLLASFSTKVSIQCASNLDKEGWTGGVQVCIQRKGHDWSILQSQTMEDLSSQYSAISYYHTLLFFLFSFQISNTSQYWVYFLCFLCRHICGVYYIIGVSREKLFFSNYFTSVIDPILLFSSFSIIV